MLFVGTKKQCQETIKEQAERVGMPYVANRWLGGLLTNFSTLSKRIQAHARAQAAAEDGSLDLLPTREAMQLRADLRKLDQNLGGVGGMERLPAAVFVVDPRKEAIVIKEARKLKIPIVALVDTNCDPDEVDYVIPGNDDAIRSCGLIVRVMADAVAEGRQMLTEAADEGRGRAQGRRGSRHRRGRRRRRRQAQAEQEAADAAQKAAEEAAVGRRGVGRSRGRGQAGRARRGRAGPGRRRPTRRGPTTAPRKRRPPRLRPKKPAAKKPSAEAKPPSRRPTASAKAPAAPETKAEPAAAPSRRPHAGRRAGT